MLKSSRSRDIVGMRKMCYALGPSKMTPFTISEDIVDQDLDYQYLEGLHSSRASWAEALPMRACMTRGSYAGMAAIGTGFTVTTRKKTSKLALAVAIVVDHPSSFHPSCSGGRK